MNFLEDPFCEFLVARLIQPGGVGLAVTVNTLQLRNKT